jgi:protein TonB
MRLDMAGTVISIDNKIGTATTVIKIPAARSYEGIFRIGGAGGASAPVCSSQPEPNYSDDGRKAHIQGVVTLDVIIQADGSIEVLRVVRGIGYGLDDEAKKVLKRWKCAPGNVDGHPVATQTQILINFHLH